MSRRNKRRMSPGVGYTGAGNKSFVFNRKPKIIFEKIKNIYGEELERINIERKSNNIPLKDIIEKERLEIRKKVKSQIRKDQIKELLTNLLILFLIIILILLIRKYYF